MKVAIYARVSTDKQDYEETQLPDLRSYVRRWGWEHDITEYVEKLSGKEGSRRPQLDKLLEAAKNGQIDVVVAWKLDRFGRSTLDTLNNVKLLSDYHVRFVCSTMPAIDTDDRSPTGKFILQIFAAVTEIERGFIVERTQAGFKAYRRLHASGHIGKLKHSKSGKDLPVGRPKCVFDHLRVHEMKAAGKSVRAIAQALKLSPTSVQRALRGA